MEMITVFFMPYAAKMITNIPYQEFYNDNVDFEDLESADFKELKARILEAETTDECIGMIEDFIIRRLIKTQDSPYFNPMAKVFERMIANPNVRIEELASVACLSERQFRRVFIENVGIKPKQIQRIQRFHLATNELQKSTPSNLEIGIWGRRHERYLKQHHKLLYFNLLTSCKLTTYLADIDTEATKMFNRLVKQLAKRDSVTEQLKAENQILWVRRMNSIHDQVTEIINNELIYV